MKLKGISWFEQHLEKVFACLFFAALLVVLALQFVGKESTVAVGKEEAPLSSAWERVGQQARTVQQKLASTATPEGDPSIATAPIVKFSERYKGPVSPTPTLAVAIGETSSIGASTVTPVAGIAPLSPVQVPAPVSPIAVSQLTLVHPDEAARDPEIAAVLPPAMPFDKAGVTVEAEFPGAALYEALSTDPDGPGGPIRAMPPHWIDSVQILMVELYREELLPDGTWGKGVSVAPMPGAWSLAKELEKPIPGAAHLKDLARMATEYAELVRRPRYFQSWIGEKWMTPSERREQDRRLLELAGVGDDVRRLRQQADDRFNTLRNIEDQLTRLGPGGAQPPGERPPRPSPAPNSGPGGKAPGGGGGGGGGGQRPPDGSRGDPNESRRKALEAQRDRVRRDLEALVVRLAAMNEDVSRYGVAAGEPAPEEAPEQPTVVEAPLLSNPAVKVWAHDVSVERGGTYRYQLRVVLNNPMFGQGNVMVPEQQEWAKAPVVRSEPSVWTDPVKVDDESYYFIVSANPGDRQMNRIAGARAELYTFKWGRWRKGDTQLEPGDRVEASVKYPDLSVLLAAAPGDAPIVAGQPGRRDPTQPPPPSPIPNSSPHDTRQPPGNLPTAPERIESPVRPGQPIDPAAVPDPTSKPLPMLTADVKVDAIFLNVGSVAVVPGSTRAGNIVYLRDPRGRIVTRLPDEEQVSGLLARLRRSAEQGDQDLRPADPIQPPDPVRPTGPSPRPTEEEPAPGGKSPGGGGGA